MQRQDQAKVTCAWPVKAFAAALLICLSTGSCGVEDRDPAGGVFMGRIVTDEGNGLADVTVYYSEPYTYSGGGGCYSRNAIKMNVYGATATDSNAYATAINGQIRDQTSTDADGYFVLYTESKRKTGDLTPSKTGYTFNPASRRVSVSETGAARDQNFVASGSTQAMAGNSIQHVVAMSPPNPVAHEKDIVARAAHAVTIMPDGTLWARGSNAYGQLGDGTIEDKDSLVRIGIENDWATVSVGYYHTVALKTDGTLWAWGSNDHGQLGDGTTVVKHVPIRIGLDNDWALTAAGESHTAAIKTDGTLWAWGSNTYGQLGDGTTLNRYAPAWTGNANTWAAVSVVGNHTAAVTIDGTLWTWGNNAWCQLGDGTNTYRYSPINVP